MSTPGITFRFCERNRVLWNGWKWEESRSGFLRKSPYQVGTTRLENGDWLVIFTDGIVEADECEG